MHLFWAKYAERCDALFQTWLLPKKLIAFAPGAYKHHVPKVWDFLAGVGVIDGTQGSRSNKPFETDGLNCRLRASSPAAQRQR